MDGMLKNLLHKVTSSNRYGLLTHTACSIGRIAQSGNAALNNLSGPRGQGTGSYDTATSVQYVCSMFSITNALLAYCLHLQHTHHPTRVVQVVVYILRLLWHLCITCQPAAMFGQQV